MKDYYELPKTIYWERKGYSVWATHIGCGGDVTGMPWMAPNSTAVPKLEVHYSRGFALLRSRPRMRVICLRCQAEGVAAEKPG